MIEDPDREAQVLALAGLFQALFLVRQIAAEGTVDDVAFERSLGSIFTIDASSAAAALGGPADLRIGLETLCRQLDPSSRACDRNLTRYAATIMHLERALARHPSHLGRIRARIGALGEEARGAQASTAPGTPLSAEVIRRLARLYVETISTLGARVLVRGEPVHLNQEDNAARIRALLLAAMRATVLWRQVGGNRLRLLLGRGRLAAHAAQLLEP